jgi:hypothetical protein
MGSQAPRRARAGVVTSTPVALSALAALVLASACGAGGPAPKAAQRPAGSGWYCRTVLQTDLIESRECVRSETDCERIQPAVDAHDPKCRREASASCHTANGGVKCFDDLYFCKRDVRMSTFAGMSDVSGCETWD